MTAKLTAARPLRSDRSLRGVRLRRPCRGACQPQLRRDDHGGHDPRGRSPRLPEQRHRDRRRRHHPRSGRPHGRRRSAPFEACPEGEFCDVGVLNDGHDGVTVRDGSVRGFGFGVFTGRARENRVLEISSSKNEFFGFLIAESTRSLFRDGSGSNNIRSRRGRDGPVRLRPHPDRRQLVPQQPARPPRRGLDRQPDQGEPVLRQRALPPGRSQPGAAQPLRGRRRRDPGRPRQRKRDRPKPRRRRGGASGSRRDAAIWSSAISSLGAHRAGIRLGLEEPEELGGASNVVRRNLVKDSGSDAFLVAPRDKRSRLTRNIAVGSNDDGFDVEGRSTKLTGNRAVRNGDLGIEAARRVINGGGNVARHNGDPRQCVHMPCR